MKNTPNKPPGRTHLVRPYLLTKGRTEASVDLSLETLIVANDKLPSAPPRKQLRQIMALIDSPLSIAEISAHLKIPIQTTKILVADLVEGNWAASHSLDDVDDQLRPDLQLLERVLDGLQSL